MTDASPDSPAAAPPPARSHPWRWWVAGAVSLLILGGTAFGLWYFLVGQKVWTDDRGIVVPDVAAELRQVLWSPPEALPGPMNTPGQEYEPSLSPDGDELYFVRGLPGKGADIHVSIRRDGAWTTPTPVAAINTAFDELGPRLAADGGLLVFYSDRPGGLGRYDLWVAARGPGGWGRPVNLGPAVNSKWNEYGATFDSTGRLYFATNRKACEVKANKDWKATIRQSEIGDYDLFVAEPVRTPASAPSSEGGVRPLPTFAPAVELKGVNTAHHEGTCCVSPMGDFLYFASDRPGGAGGFDLYRCRLLDGVCGPVEDLGPQINTAANEADPQLALGGFRMLFSSDRKASRGGYDLFRTDSREVYAHFMARPAPRLGWHAWGFLVALAVLIPLLLLLKAGGYRHLSLLQKCAVVSLLAHLLLMMSFNFLNMARSITEFVRKDAGLTVAVNLDIAREVETREEVRDQISDLPAPEPEVTDLAPVERIEPTRAAPLPADFDVQKVIVKPASMTRLPDAPDFTPPEPTDQLSLPPPIRAMTPHIELTPPKPVAETEARPEPKPATIEPLKPAPRRPVAPPPKDFAMAVRRVKATPDSLATAVEATPPSPAPTETVRPTVAPPRVEAVDAAPAPPGRPLPADRRPDPTVRETAVEVARARPGAPAAGTAAEIKLRVRPVDVRAESLAAAVEVRQPAAAAPVRPVAALPRAPAPDAAAPAIRPRVAKAAEGVAVGEADTRVTRADAPLPRAGVPTEVALDAGKVDLTVGSLLRAADPASTATVAPTAKVDPATDLHEPPVLAVDALQPVATPVRQAAARPAVGETDVRPGRVGPASPAGTADDVRVAAAPVTIRSKSIARTPATTQPKYAAPDRTPRTAAALPLEDLDVAGPTVAPRAVARQAPRPRIVEPDAALDKADATSLAARGARPSNVALPAAAAKIDPTSVARPARAGPPVAPVAGARWPEPRSTFAASVDVGAPAAPTPLLAARPDAAPMVVEAAAEARRAPTASPMGRPLPAKVSLPAADVTDDSLVVAAAAAPRAGRPDVRVAVDLPTRAGAVVVSLPAVAAAAPVPAPPVVAAGTRAPRAAPRQRPGAARARPTADSPDAPAAAATELASLARRAADRGRRPGPDHAVADRVTPRARPAGPTGNLGPGRQAAPPALAHRSFQQRRRLLDEMGGSNESEAGVSRALVYLAKNQEPDGRWTYVEDRRPRRTRSTDMALTGLSTLCFLAADHTPARPGPYRQSVARAMDYLLAQQKPDGDLRGRGRMYCHAIATLAIAEAAIMTGDERYRDAAVKGAKFIIKAQNRRTGGWRYSPGDTGDTSVVGWQVMALRSVERLGYKIPDSCRKGAFRWLDSVGAGKQRMLAGYTGRAPKPAMVAEAMFSRILLGQQLTEAQQKEACDYLLKHMPDRGRPHYYYWYYASLAMAQLRNDAWTKWNARMRDHLIKLQRKSGRLDGSWDTRSAYGARAGSGRVYTTAMATLTLEVYYRYLPMYGGKGPGAVDPAPAPPSKD